MNTRDLLVRIYGRLSSLRQSVDNLNTENAAGDESIYNNAASCMLREEIDFLAALARDIEKGSLDLDPPHW